MNEETIARVKELSLRDYLGDIPKNNKVICPKCHSGTGKHKTPALHIYKKHGYCFACHKKFDIIGYVMYGQGLHYWEAVKYLASMYGISIEKMDKILHVGNKIFFNKKNAVKYERELEMKEIVDDEIGFRITINRWIDDLMSMKLIDAGQEITDLYIVLIKAFNKRYGRLV